MVPTCGNNFMTYLPTRILTAFHKLLSEMSFFQGLPVEKQVCAKTFTFWVFFSHIFCVDIMFSLFKTYLVVRPLSVPVYCHMNTRHSLVPAARVLVTELKASLEMFLVAF